jgi:hypothetical protein
MGDLIDAVSVGLTRRDPPPSNALSPAENAEILASAVGGGRAAARLLGIGESTFRGWRAGRQPRKGGDLLVAAARAATAGRRYDAAYAGETELEINGLIIVSSDARIRTIHPGRNIPLRQMRNVLRAWINGDDSRAERLLAKHIDEFYQPMEFDNILWAEFA